VFNCGGETRYSQEDEVYKVRSLALSVAVGKEAAKRGIKVFVELSTGMVYKPDSQPSKEGDKTKPWSKIAVFKLQAEEQLSKIEGWVVFRRDGCRRSPQLLIYFSDWPFRSLHHITPVPLFSVPTANLFID
jgi:dTDP-4-dehydrorhamnose reductase